MFQDFNFIMVRMTDFARGKPFCRVSQLALIQSRRLVGYYFAIAPAKHLSLALATAKTIAVHLVLARPSPWAKWAYVFICVLNDLPFYKIILAKALREVGLLYHM